MPTPESPDPINEALSSGSGHLGWPDFATIMGALVVVFTFLGTLLLKKGKHKEEASERESLTELELLKSKLAQVRVLAEDLDERYSELKKEIRSLEETVEENDKDSSKSIRKLETEIEELKRRMDKIIELILKLLSEQ